MNDISVEANGETLRVLEAGREGAPALFFFHSLGTSSELWRQQLDHFSATHRVIAMDCRGHGGSSNRGGFSVTACVADALAVLRARGVGRCVIIGLSMGGLMTAELASRMPQAGLQCAGMVLACSYRYAGGPQAQARIDSTRALLSQQGMVAFARTYMTGTACPSMPVESLEAMVKVIAGMKADDYLQTISAILTHDAGPALASVQDVPALIISGDLDSRVPPDVLADLCRSVPQATHVKLQRAGHLANLEEPDSFNQALRRFVQG